MEINNSSFQKGFTLLELIISITLVSFVVLLLAMAMRSGLRAYERAKNLGGKTLLTSSVINLLDRQMAMVVSGKNSHTKSFMRFEGDEKSLLFTTTAGPTGAGGGGILLAFYEFNEEKEALIYCQKILTRPQDLETKAPQEISKDSLEELRKDGWDCDIVDGISNVSFKFTDKEDDTDIDSWDDKWTKKNSLPVAIAIKIKDEWMPFLLTDAVN